MSRIFLFRTPQRGPWRVFHIILSVVVAAFFVSGLWFTALPAFPDFDYARVSTLSEASPREMIIVFLCALLAVTLFIIAFNKAVDRLLGTRSQNKSD